MHALKPKHSLFALPIQAHHGSSDCCTSMKAHLAFMDAVGSQDKNMKAVEGGYHEEFMVR
jgi:alpha-beta hydrolase superfamily lysophospholipase